MGEATIAVSHSLSVDQAERISRRVDAAIKAFAPGSEISLIAAPRTLDDETVIERTRMVGARRHMPVHHIVAQEIEGRLSISLDLEVDGGMSLRSAHKMASELEEAIRDEFGAEVEIETHMEPAAPLVMVGHDVDSATRETIEKALVRCAAKDGVLRHVHDLRVRGVAEDSSSTTTARSTAPSRSRRRMKRSTLSSARCGRSSRRYIRIAGHCEPLGTNEFGNACAGVK